MPKSHSAADAALGFYFQAFYALLVLLKQDSDNAAVGVEQLDDVGLKADGRTLLIQLKHSMAAVPTPVTLKSVSLWKTVKAWIDVLDEISLPETGLHLVTTAPLSANSPLAVLLVAGSDRSGLVHSMVEEAERVASERAKVLASGKVAPHGDRWPGCEAFLALTEAERLNLIRSMVLKPSSPKIAEIEVAVAEELKFLPPVDRPIVAERLTQWWDREIVYSLCGQRDRVITRAELQQKISSIVAEIEHEVLLPDFELATPPGDYQPDGMLVRQIHLVKGRDSDLKRAIREEWKAREQRGKWTHGSPAMATIIGDYDTLLEQEWADHHLQMSENCIGLDAVARSKAGLALLRWSHEQAPNTTRPITKGWDAAYYVRGSYQVLAIDLRVGWHADFATLLRPAE